MGKGLCCGSPSRGATELGRWRQARATGLWASRSGIPEAHWECLICPPCIAILTPTSTVAEIINAVRSLSEADKDDFLDQLRQVEFEDAWDRQMESDATAGKLDFLVREADEAVNCGTLRDWPGKQT
jgi:hypothetical protein